MVGVVALGVGMNIDYIISKINTKRKKKHSHPDVEKPVMNDTVEIVQLAIVAATLSVNEQPLPSASVPRFSR